MITLCLSNDRSLRSLFIVSVELDCSSDTDPAMPSRSRSQSRSPGPGDLFPPINRRYHQHLTMAQHPQLNHSAPYARLPDPSPAPFEGARSTRPSPPVTMPSAPSTIQTSYPPSMSRHSSSDEETRPLTAGLGPYAQSNDSFASHLPQQQHWTSGGQHVPPPLPMPMPGQQQQQIQQMQPGSYYPPTNATPNFSQPSGGFYPK